MHYFGPSLTQYCLLMYKLIVKYDSVVFSIDVIFCSILIEFCFLKFWHRSGYIVNFHAVVARLYSIGDKQERREMEGCSLVLSLVEV